MIKVFLSVRNRLGLTKQCLEALRRYTKAPLEIYVFDNLTEPRLLAEHAAFFADKILRGEIAQYVINTAASTHGSFSLCAAATQFADQYARDARGTCKMILQLDNDVIVEGGWDSSVRLIWDAVKKAGIDTVQYVSPFVWGSHKTDVMVGEVPVCVGLMGGSAFMAMQPDFYSTIGMPEPRLLRGKCKGYDRWLGWHIEAKIPESYAATADLPLATHCGPLVASICNRLHNGEEAYSPEIEEHDRAIGEMSFEDFREMVAGSRECARSIG